MKNGHVTVLAAAVILGAACETAAADGARVAAVRPASVKSADDVVKVEIVVANSSDRTLYVDVPLPGSDRVQFKTGDGWVSRFGADKVPRTEGKDGFKIFAGVIQGFTLVVEPGKTGSFSIDLRDFFEKINLNQPRLRISLKLAGVLRNVQPDKPDKKAAEDVLLWDGEIEFAVKTKSTIIQL